MKENFKIYIIKAKKATLKRFLLVFTLDMKCIKICFFLNKVCHSHHDRSIILNANKSRGTEKRNL